MIKKLVEEQILDALKKLSIDVPSVNIEHPNNLNFGDYTTNIAMQLAKQLKKSPIQIAEEIARNIDKGTSIEKIEVVKPGFINIKLSTNILKENVYNVSQAKNLIPKIGNDKKVIVEYSSPNIAKPFTIGHLRSTIIGNAISNLLQTIGFHVYRDNHVGDWGTQFGKQIYAIKTWGNEKEIESSERPVKKLVELYIKFHEEAEKKPELEEEGRKWFKKLEEGDEEAKRLWQKCIEWSWKEFEKIYQQLHVSFTENNGRGYGEAFFEDKMDQVIDELKQKKLLKESQGSQLIFYPKDKFPPLMIIKKDGATLYSTRDLATDKFRLQHYGNDIIVINEVGAEQTLYFRQLYETEYMLHWYNPGQRIHVAHGMYRFKDSKMSTRKGNVIWLEEVLNEAIQRAKELIKKEDIQNVKDVDLLAEKVGIGAIKWNDLKKTSHQDVIFDWDDMLNMQGNSGPYMQYTFVRTQSVLNKSNLSAKSNNYQPNDEEFRIMQLINYYGETVQDAALKYSPHILCTYLFDLAQSYNLFYQKHSILKAEEDIKNFRLTLTQAVAQILKNGLNLLGIETVQKM